MKANLFLESPEKAVTTDARVVDPEGAAEKKARDPMPVTEAIEGKEAKDTTEVERGPRDPIEEIELRDPLVMVKAEAAVETDSEDNAEAQEEEAVLRALVSLSLLLVEEPKLEVAEENSEVDSEVETEENSEVDSEAETEENSEVVSEVAQEEKKVDTQDPQLGPDNTKDTTLKEAVVPASEVVTEVPPEAAPEELPDPNENFHLNLKKTF
jgi:hypothetical protein